ncbi:MAG: YtxH domain-containing protein [Desulfobulbaceae bacterium]|nr:YtxH domain-containing protein [Desulfobulbaceae bacterium]
MILKEIADNIRRSGLHREQTLRRNRAGMLALGVVIGGTVGAAAGVLFAPRAGKETREDLSRRSSEAWEKVKENASTTGQQLVSAVEEKSSRVRTAAEKGVDAAKKGVDAARESLKEPSGESEEKKG